MAVPDFDADGRLDIDSGVHEDAGLMVYFSQGKSIFGTGLEIAGREALPWSMIAADLNRDGQPEIIVGYRGTGRGVFQRRQWQEISASPFR
jgi:FG-GAP-like repeat